VLFLNRRLLDHHDRHPPLTSLPLLVKYLALLLCDIVAANIHIACLALRPSLSLAPVVLHVPTRLRSDWTKTLLGNSITLTPGTLTLEIRDSTFVVHVITRGAEERGRLPRLIALLEEMERRGRGPIGPDAGDGGSTR